MSDNSSHLHRIPSSSSSHDISIERVQNTFMSQLQRIKQDTQISRIFLFSSIPLPLGLIFLPFPFLHKVFEFISSVSESSHCVNIEWILSHANNVFSHILKMRGLVLVNTRTVIFDSFSKIILKLFFIHRSSFLLFIHELLLNLFIFFLEERISCSFPLPFHLSFTFIFIFVIETGCANLIVYNWDWLKSVW